MTAVRQQLVCNASYAQLMGEVGWVGAVRRDTVGVQWVGDVMEAVVGRCTSTVGWR